MSAVLIVEDEPLIRMGAVKIIEDAGFEVIEAASADEAIRILECRSDIRVGLRIFTCRGQWMVSNSLMPSAIGGRQSR